MSSKVIKSIMPVDFQWQTKDPFLFCAYHNDSYPEGNEDSGPRASLQGRNIGMDFEIKDGWRMYHGDRVPGFPVHPHRGFETVTIVQQGLVDHADSMGAAGRYGDGDVQWMTAGRGIQHSEMFPLVNQDKPNTLELFQLWLNLPATNKMVQPHFSMFWSSNIPKKCFQDEAGRQTQVDIIAGALGDTEALSPPPDSWAGNADNHVAIWTIVMSASARWLLPGSAAGLNRILYFYRGNLLNIDGTDIAPMHCVELQSDVDVMLENADEECRILLLQGRPINEPVEQYGPFVMNTRNEIMQAMQDYQETEFGGWPWPSRDTVHKGKERFARHADGKTEEAE